MVDICNEEDFGFFITWKATFFINGYAAGKEIGATQIGNSPTACHA